MDGPWSLRRPLSGGDDALTRAGADPAMADEASRHRMLLDLTCLRTFVAVGQSHSISAAAAIVHLSQSAISLQMQRLEDQLGQTLLERHSRGVRLTVAGEKLLRHATHILEANRQAVADLLSGSAARSVRLGAPHDLLYPAVPDAIRRLSQSAPGVEVALETASSRTLREKMTRGELEIAITTEFELPEEARPIGRRKVAWVAAKGSCLAASRPLRLAFTRGCVFRAKALSMLEDAALRFILVVDSSDVRAVEAAVASDQGIHAMMVDNMPAHLEIVGPEAGLPSFPDAQVNLYVSESNVSGVAQLASALKQAFAPPPG